jgi:hypothetical protein
VINLGVALGTLSKSVRERQGFFDKKANERLKMDAGWREDPL